MVDVPKEVFVNSVDNQVLVVQAYPLGAIVKPSTYPLEARAGNAFTVSGTIRNDGAQGFLIAKLIEQGIARNPFTGEPLETVAPDIFYDNIPPNETGPFEWWPIMPSQDWALRIEVGHWEYDPGTFMDTWRIDDFEEFTVIQLIDILTALTLFPPAPSYRPGEPYFYEGDLIRTDTGEALAGEIIHLEREEMVGDRLQWVELGQETTDAGGHYGPTSFPTPVTAGIYNIRSRYFGTPGYFAASVAQAKIGVGLAAPLIPVMLAELLGAGLLYVALRR